MTTYVTEFKSSQNVDKVSCKKYASLCHVTKPILYMMQLFGVYFYEPDIVDHTSDIEGCVSRPKPRIAFFKWYCVCLTVLSGLNVVRYIPSFWVGVDFVPNLTVMRIIAMSWLLQYFLTRLFLLRACWSRSHFAEYFTHFDRIMTDTCCMSITPTCSRSRRYSIGVVIVAWLVTILTSSLDMYDLITYNSVVLCNPFSYTSIAVKIFFIVLVTLERGAYVFSILFQVVLFRILRDQFSSYTNVLCKMTKDEGSNLWQKMKDVRLKHLQLCKAVAILEQDTQYLIAVNFVTNIFLMCFIVYQMVETTSAVSLFDYITYSSWLVMNFSVIASTSITAAQVNEEAHSPLEYIFNVEMDEVSRSEALQMQLFLSKLNGPPIGFTVLGLVTITKEFILTLAGLILTYFFLLLQFSI